MNMTTEQINARRALARALSDRRRARSIVNHHARAAARMTDEVPLASIIAIGRDMITAERAEIEVQRATAEFFRLHPDA
jgi:hypothetical protein